MYVRTNDGLGQAAPIGLTRQVNRSSREYVRWVQRSLNSILGIDLNVDGVMGPQTRSAIRNFQQKQGLVADGIVGPKTEAALIKAASGAAPGPVTTTDIDDALRNRQWSRAVGLSVLRGVSPADFGNLKRLRETENRLADMVFFARHPERRGQRLQPGERGYQQLREEWLDLRNVLVRTALGEKYKDGDPTQLPEPPLDRGRQLSWEGVASLFNPLQAYHVLMCRLRGGTSGGKWGECYSAGVLGVADCIRKIQKLQRAASARDQR